jgi:aldehyde dehydrogenase (NAD+)
MTTIQQDREIVTIESEIARIFALQGGAQQAVRATDAAARLAKLRKLGKAIESRAGAVFAALAEDLGKPQNEAVGDFGSPLWEIALAEEGLEEWMAAKDVPLAAGSSATARIIYEPKGKVLIFGAWNYPFGLSLQPLVAAIMAGNTVVLKPSELSPATSAVIAELVRDCFDESEVAVIEGGPEVARALLEFPFDHIFFTGSTSTGRQVMAAAARHLASVTLELGGKSPVIVDRGMDLGKVASAVIAGKCGNSGQVCVAPDHVWIAAEERDAFVVQAVRQIAASHYDGAQLREDTLACIVNTRNLTRLRGLIDDAVARGASIAHGGAISGMRMEPTILIDVPLDADIMQEEVFGPILPVLAYSDKNEPLAQIARSGKPLALYVFSDSEDFVQDILGKTSSGGVTVNDVMLHPTVVGLPFGGVGSSGTGAYHGIFSFLELSHQRAVYVQGANSSVGA